MLLGDIRLTADDHVQLYDVDGSLQATLTVADALDFYIWCRQRLHQLNERYRQQQIKEDRAKAKETQQ